MSKKVRYKTTLKYLIIAMVASILIVDLSIILIPDSHFQHGVAIISLNIVAIIATILGTVAVFRHGLKDRHGKSYLFLTIGIALWFAADLGIMFSYFVLKTDEFKHITILDVLWLSGYVFLILHLISIIKTIRIKNQTITISILSGVVVGFVLINIINIMPISGLAFTNNTSSIKMGYYIQDIVITVLYPILDLCLIVPSITILLNVYKDYQHSIPWILASISLLVNALADNGYAIQFINGSPSAMPWDLFYIADFIIMSGALFWYNKYHITEHISKNNEKNI